MMMESADSPTSPELADRIDDALASLWSGDSAAFERLLGAQDDAEEAGAVIRAGRVGDALRDAAAGLGRPALRECAPVIPGFEIIGEIGRGGMGVVYEARQLHPSRSVAVKVQQSARAADRHHRLMFDREIRALAALDHPHIASLHSAGNTSDGRSYFVMELVRGQPITDFADAHRLDHAARLELLCQLCDAVHHAHLRGVIHRDLKPSNVLVGEASSSSAGTAATAASGWIKVLDFGLARLTEQGASEHSQALEGVGIKGTFAYMSPEQLRGQSSQIDARSDVYALGVMLHQLMTGRLPIDITGKPLPQAVRALEEHESGSMSRFDRTLRGDLDIIAAKALERDPQRRYQSAAQLAEDIRRFLRCEPIFARPASTVYLLRQFARRNRALVAGAAAVLAALLLGLAAATLALMQANRARDQTRQAEQTSEQINSFLNQMLASADPGVTRGHDIRVSAVLDEAAKRLDGGALRGVPEAEARVRQTIGETYLSLGLFPEAAAQFEAALSIRTGPPSGLDSSGVRVLMDLADAHRRLGQYDAAENEISRAIDAARAIAPDPQFDPLVFTARESRARLLRSAGRDAESKALYAQLYQEALQRSGGADSDELARTMMAGGTMGQFLQGDEQNLEYIRTVTEGVAMYRRLHGADDDKVATAMVNFGFSLVAIRRYAEAEATLKEAIEIRRRLYGDDHPGTAVARYNLGACYQAQKDYTQAEDLLRAALGIFMRRLPPGHHDTCRAQFRLGEVLAATGRPDEAEPLFRQSLEAWQQHVPERFIYVTQAQRAIAQLMLDRKQYAEAESLYLNALAIYTTHATLPSTVPGQIMQILVRLYQDWGKPEQAEQWQARLGASSPASAPASRPAP